MNTTKTQEQGKNQEDAFKKMQGLAQTNALGGLSANLKRARTKLDQLTERLQQRIKQSEERKAQEKKDKPEAVKPVEVKKPEPKVEVQQRPVEQKRVAPSSQAQNQTRSFADRRQGGQNYQQGGFRERPQQGNFGDRQRPAGAKPQGGFGERRPQGGQQFGQRNGQFGQKPAFGDKPRPQGPRLSPMSNADKMDASTLIKPNSATNHTSAKKKSFDKGGDDKKSMNKKALVMRGYVEDDSLFDDGERMGSKKRGKKQKEVAPVVVAPKIDHAVITTDNLTVKLLAEKIGRPVAEIMSKFLLLGMMVNINSNIDYDSAELIASELGVTLEKKVEKSYEEKLADIHSAESDDEKSLQKRPPVVTVMGHVDHGKTSLLDYIRKTNVISGEAGGITQHIGAYQIKVNGEVVTFIDTPGHAAFDAMRKRGASLTDVAILVVAADDGVMPQTKESIKFIQEAKVPMIVAINKVDLPTANVDKVKEQLAAVGVMPEEWGGETIMVPISAKKGMNVDKLLEMVLFVAEYQNLRANPDRKASGSIIEARLDKGMGTVATVLVQNGTLNIGDTVVAGTATGKVRAMINENGVHIKKATPSTPVAILGLTSVPNAGDQLYVVDEKFSKQILTERTNKQRTSMIKAEDLSLDNLLNKIADSNFKDYNVIIKGDVQGSIEALKQSLAVVQNDEVKVRPIHGGVGAINENDVMLAEASNAVIIGFNVKPDAKAKAMAEKNKVDIKFFRIIYEAIDFVTEEINKMLTPKYREVVTGHAEVRALFKASKVGVIAGSYVLDGKISKNSKARLLRKDKQVYDGSIATLQREKNEVKDVNAGFEFGATLQGFTDIQVGDIIETYALERI
ncbi:MAG: translation initiation factor IF-2 [Clostridia bacterium]|nr:translation initiation factor IF-2 [Clostridia bacterium]